MPFDSDEGRYKLSKDYLTSALEIYERKQEYAWASNVYLSLAQNYATIDHDAAEACKMLDLSLAAHRKWMTIHPDAQVTLPRGVASYEELIKRTKDQVPCQAS